MVITTESAFAFVAALGIAMLDSFFGKCAITSHYIIIYLLFLLLMKEEERG